MSSAVLVLEVVLSSGPHRLDMDALCVPALCCLASLFSFSPMRVACCTIIGTPHFPSISSDAHRDDVNVWLQDFMPPMDKDKIDIRPYNTRLVNLYGTGGEVKKLGVIT